MLAFPLSTKSRRLIQPWPTRFPLALVGGMLTLVAGVAWAYSVSPQTSGQTWGLNLDDTECVWTCSGTGYYDKGDYMGIGPYSVSLPEGNPPNACVIRLGLVDCWCPEVGYRMCFFESTPTGDTVYAESCPQDNLDQIPWVPPLDQFYSSLEMNAEWVPNATWWASDNAVQCFYKVQTHGDIGGWAASQAAL